MGQKLYKKWKKWIYFQDNDLRSLTKTINKLIKNLKKIKINLNKVEEKIFKLVSFETFKITP